MEKDLNIIDTMEIDSIKNEMMIREFIARVAAVANIYVLKRKPRLLGPTVKIL